MPFNEFDLIQFFFNQEKINRADVVLGIGDDAAILQPSADQQLLVTTDTLVVEQHFSKETSAFDIGYKSLAVNLSDLAAMGAEPAWILLALTLPAVNEKWLTHFAEGFFSLMRVFKCQLVGGDITRGPLSITVQALGFAPVGKILRRSGAQVGDRIYVTGTLGDAGLALAYLQNKISPTPIQAHLNFLLARLNRPEPRIAVGIALRDIAHCAIDISDGLAADFQHVLKASQVGATIDIGQLPLSHALLSLKSDNAYSLALSAGDDYELCFTVSKKREKDLVQALKSIACPYTAVGFINEGSELLLQNKNREQYFLKQAGFLHF